MIAWQKPQRWYLESECGGFRVSKILSNGAPSYSCWQKANSGWEPVRNADGFVAVFPSARDAQAFLSRSRA